MLIVILLFPYFKLKNKFKNEVFQRVNAFLFELSAIALVKFSSPLSVLYINLYLNKLEIY